MIPLSLDQIATIVGGTLNEAADPHTVVNGTVEFDSRKVTPGGGAFSMYPRGTSRWA